MPIEPVDLDGQAINVEAAMTTACSKTFAMVGGGFALDTNMFSGKDGATSTSAGSSPSPASRSRPSSPAPTA